MHPVIHVYTTIYHSNTPLNNPYTPRIRPKYTLNTPLHDRYHQFDPKVVDAVMILLDELKVRRRGGVDIDIDWR